MLPRLHAGQTRAPAGLLTDLVGLVRYAIGARAVLAPFAPDVNRNFELWLGREKKAGRDYTEAQMEWLRLMKDWVASNVELTLADRKRQPVPASESVSLKFHGRSSSIRSMVWPRARRSSTAVM
ncbi:type I restriction-modification enzyme R subunit C-terminal domain-containing protein [Pseudoroseomonas cervicalis]|uniref:type I restriction-modification enzyme R subunit C-terminal domain-containing protein n=1 Tax=Teichococcus cervicalis TaxID=204525 RepID=UPI0022F192B1|nr:type I restriction-modification enzyme R subunit C-terminal domain-containing protein [Pseudoroseomonas cervicalis]WBV43534.1 hypothetical protein PFY06_02895 [Pseudoroseomonas cervicalis]